MVKLAHAQAWDALVETERRRAALLAGLSLDSLAATAKLEFIDLLKRIQSAIAMCAPMSNPGWSV
jgi:hypothetical protein